MTFFKVKLRLLVESQAIVIATPERSGTFKSGLEALESSKKKP